MKCGPAAHRCDGGVIGPGIRIVIYEVGPGFWECLHCGHAQYYWGNKGEACE